MHPPWSSTSHRHDNALRELAPGTGNVFFCRSHATQIITVLREADCGALRHAAPTGTSRAATPLPHTTRPMRSRLRRPTTQCIYGRLAGGHPSTKNGACMPILARDRNALRGSFLDVAAARLPDQLAAAAHVPHRSQQLARGCLHSRLAQPPQECLARLSLRR